MSEKFNPKGVGEMGEAVILGRLAKLKKVVLMPFGNNQKYDLVVDAGGGKFIRGQCKTARILEGSLRFETCSRSSLTRERTPYNDSVDMFWVYCQDNDTCYEVPATMCRDRFYFSMRIEPTKYGYEKPTTRWAKDFIL